MSASAESIVPGAGCVTALYACSRADAYATQMSGPVISVFSASASFSPRMIWERMTPLLPRAPMSAPCAAAAETAATVGSAFRAYASAERIVWSMFVPVSPSGTG
jgi:hypothetical protein